MVRSAPTRAREMPTGDRIQSRIECRALRRRARHPALALVMLLGCASDPAPAASRLVTMPHPPRGDCKSLGSLVGEGRGEGQLSSERWTQAELELKRKATQAGATHLYVMPPKVG